MRSVYPSACTVLLVLPLLVCAEETPALLESDAAVLRELLQAWRPEDWDLATHHCMWPGIQCEIVDVGGTSFFSGKQKRHVVRSITLRKVCDHVPDDHICEIPPAIGQLQYVESLYLAGNGFHGHIPEEMGALRTLKHLFLNTNQLWGEIPESIGDLTALQKLHLNHNKLSGEIPAALGRASKLHQLELHNNELSGQLPPELGSLKELVQLDLNDNELEGGVPTSYGDLSQLHRLDLHNNLLEGPIPQHLFDSQMSQLSLVNLSNNRFTGHIPLGLCRMVHLASLNLEGNKGLVGQVPHCKIQHGIHADQASRASCQEQLRPFCRSLKSHGEL